MLRPNGGVMDEEERARVKAAAKEEFRPMLMAAVEEVERILRALGRTMPRASVVRALKASVVSKIPKVLARQRGLSISADELRMRFEAFNELMDEMLLRASN